MRAIIQRVSQAAVCIAGETVGSIGPGLLVLLGIEGRDGDVDVQWLSRKIPHLRIFPDDSGRMNRSVKDIGGGILVVSQFTLFASTRKGQRPAFLGAADPEQAVPLYEQFLERVAAELGAPVASGRFGADMQVALVNDGPVTIPIDTKRRE
ncbi:MAG: D-aminoacyl-tRNA deacylase [Planctomycetota bacterium]